MVDMRFPAGGFPCGSAAAMPAATAIMATFIVRRGKGSQLMITRPDRLDGNKKNKRAKAEEARLVMLCGSANSSLAEFSGPENKLIVYCFNITGFLLRKMHLDSNLGQ
jgi:hypothetical protein